VEDDEIVGILARQWAAELEVLEVEWKSRFHCEERQVTHYRVRSRVPGRDAAHVHSPMGGQGMNTGIQECGEPRLEDRRGAGRRRRRRASTATTTNAIPSQASSAAVRPDGAWRHASPPSRAADANLPGARLLRVPRVRDAVAGSFAERRCGMHTEAARAHWWATAGTRFR